MRPRLWYNTGPPVFAGGEKVFLRDGVVHTLLLRDIPPEDSLLSVALISSGVAQRSLRIHIPPFINKCNGEGIAKSVSINCCNKVTVVSSLDNLFCQILGFAGKFWCVVSYLFTHPRFEGREYKTKKEVAHTFYAQPPRHKHLTNSETKKGADLAKCSAKSAPESLGR